MKIDDKETYPRKPRRRTAFRISQEYNDKPVKSRPVRRLGNILSSIFLGIAVLIFVGAVAFVALGKSTEDIYIFGYKPFIIVTGSMETEYMTNSTVVIKQGGFDEVNIGDVIAFRADAMGGKLAFHRVIKKTADGFITKGDNTQVADSQVVTRDKFLGHEVFHTNVTAYYISELHKPQGMLRMVVLPILAIIMFCIGISLFNRWSADPRLKRTIGSGSLLVVFVIALVFYTLWDNKRIDLTNNQLQSSAETFLSVAGTDATTTVNNRTVIGVIKIPSLSLEYPIIKYENDSSLDIAISQYSGPTLNQIGNVVLLGHRSANGGNLFFTNIDKLRIGDSVTIFDKAGEALDYHVVSFAIHQATDFSILKHENAETLELTLVSCSPDLVDRYVVKLVTTPASTRSDEPNNSANNDAQ